MATVEFEGGDSLFARTGTIKLTQEEAALVDSITFDPLKLDGNHNENGGKVAVLTHLLLERGAIPPMRAAWFGNAEHNIRGRGESYFKGFKDRVGSKDAVYRDQDFLKYLHYFIFGATLSDSVRKAFCEKVESFGNMTSGDRRPLIDLVKRLATQCGLRRPEAANEFYKLALDCGIPWEARPIYDAVMKMTRLPA